MPIGIVSLFTGRNVAQKAYDMILTVRDQELNTGFPTHTSIHSILIHKKFIKLYSQPIALLTDQGSISGKIFLFLAGRGVQCVLWGSLPDFFRERTYAQVSRDLWSHIHSCTTGKKKLSTSFLKNQH